MNDESDAERQARLLAEANAEASADANSSFQESLTDKPDVRDKSVWGMLLGGASSWTGNHRRIELLKRRAAQRLRRPID